MYTGRFVEGYGLKPGESPGAFVRLVDEREKEACVEQGIPVSDSRLCLTPADGLSCGGGKSPTDVNSYKISLKDEIRRRNMSKGLTKGILRYASVFRRSSRSPYICEGRTSPLQDQSSHAESLAAQMLRSKTIVQAVNEGIYQGHLEMA